MKTEWSNEKRQGRIQQSDVRVSGDVRMRTGRLAVGCRRDIEKRKNMEWLDFGVRRMEKKKKKNVQ